MPRILPDIPRGTRFGALSVLGRDGSSKAGNRLYLCRCDCGNTCDVTRAHLSAGSRTSCGCRWSSARKHGHCPKQKRSPTYTSWSSMLSRTRAKRGRHHAEYVLRGITVCRWSESFENFLADMGPRPSSRHSIDRKNNDGNYEPGNCRWATARQQQLNHRRPWTETSGVRWIARLKKWSVMLKILGKSTYLGLYTNLDEAKRVARAGHKAAVDACEKEANAPISL
jgi:hypothetical protein